MAKRRQKTTAQPTRKQVRVSRREQSQQRLVIGITIFVGVVVAALLGYGLFDQFVLSPKRTVARVGQLEISYADLDKGVRFQRVQLLNQYGQLLSFSQFAGGQQNVQDQLAQLESRLHASNALVLSRTILDSLIEEELARAEAERLGIEVSEAEVDERLERFFGYFPDGTPTPNPSPTFLPSPTATDGPTPTLDPEITPTEEEPPTPGATTSPQPTATEYTQTAYESEYGEYIDSLTRDAEMTEADVRGIFRAAILDEKIREVVITDIPTEEENVNARHILLSLEDQELAEEVLARALDGEDFAALAAEFSTDESNASAGGDLGWFPRGRMVPPFETAAFDNEVGVVPQLVESQFGYHIIEVLGKELRPIPESQIEQQSSAAYREWLFNLRSNSDVEIFTWWESRPPAEPDLAGYVLRLQNTQEAAATSTAAAAPPETATEEPVEVEEPEEEEPEEEELEESQ